MSSLDVGMCVYGDECTKLCLGYTSNIKAVVSR